MQELTLDRPGGSAAGATAMPPPAISPEEAELLTLLSFGGYTALGVSAALSVFTTLHALTYGGWHGGMWYLVEADVFLLAVGLGLHFCGPMIAAHFAAAK